MGEILKRDSSHLREKKIMQTQFDVALSDANAKKQKLEQNFTREITMKESSIKKLVDEVKNLKLKLEEKSGSLKKLTEEGESQKRKLSEKDNLIEKMIEKVKRT